MSAHTRPVRPWQHWRFAVAVTVCWAARRHFLDLQRTSDRGYRFFRCRVCRCNIVDTRGASENTATGVDQ